MWVSRDVSQRAPQARWRREISRSLRRFCPRSRDSFRERRRSSPGRSKALHVCTANDCCTSCWKAWLLLFGLLHQLLGHLLEGLLLLLGQLHALLGSLLEGLFEGLLPLLRLLGNGQVQNIEDLQPRTHGLLHHLLKRFLLPLDLIAHGLHSGDPPSCRRPTSPPGYLRHKVSMFPARRT
jgi:hypothetical protein